MKKTLYFFSENLPNTLLDQLIQSVPEIGDYFELIKCQNLTAEETIENNFDIIHLSENDFKLFMPYMKMIEWKISHMGVADILIKKKNKTFQPLNLNSDCIYQQIKNLNIRLNTAELAMFIGSYDFVLSNSVKMALVGYTHLVISVKNEIEFNQIKSKLKEFIFNLDIQYVPLSELTQVKFSIDLLVSNMSPEIDAEAFESLTYFNFLKPKAIFIDFQSFRNDSLVHEARRAELNVVEELEILSLKYKTLIELCKNSSFV